MEPIFEILQHDHKRLQHLMQEAERTKDTVRRRGLIEELEETWEMHACAEEEILYPRLKEDETLETLVDDAFDTFYDVRQSVDRLRGAVEANAEGERKAALSQLKQSLAQHVKEEEREMFPRMRKVFNTAELEDMRAGFVEVKRQLRREIAV